MPPVYTQANRPIAVTTPLGADKLLLIGYSGSERLSELFHFELDLLALSDTQVGFDQVLGQSVTITHLLPDGSKRFINGIAQRLTQAGRVATAQGNDTMIRYRMEVVPKAWLLTKRRQSRIFQQLTVVDILKKVLTGLDVAWETQGTYEPRDYCTQYRESDFDFACRLMEEEGIYYYFKHADGSHKMVVADTPQSHVDVPGATTVIYETVAGGLREENRVTSWEKTQEIRSGKYTLWDHCFELNAQNLEATKPILAAAAVGTVTHKLQVGGNDTLEVYDYPGGYAQRFDGIAPGGGDRASDVQKIFQDNARTVGIRMQQETTPGLIAMGQGNCSQFVAGHRFTLDRHFDANGAYVLTRVKHLARLEGAYVNDGDAAFEYINEFDCLPAAIPFCPERTTRRPTVEGSQTAVVVGPAGEEIFTDKYGRVKVQFHWDRDGKKDASSSCWLRVGTHWAGKQWGLIHIPRIGQEVIVDFLEGDPDQPIIVGSVYNAENMPPYTLPDNKTQSGLKTRSSLQGTAEQFNELRFEDKKDSEEIYFHAQKDFNRVVENNDTLKVGSDQAADGSQTIEIYKDRTETVKTGDESVTIEQGKRTIIVKQGDDTHQVDTGNYLVQVKTGDRTVLVDTGNETHTIKTGNRVVEVSTGNDTHTVKTGNREVSIDTGNDALTIKSGNQTIKLDLGGSTTEAMQSIELKVGQNSIKIDQSGITIGGMMLKLEGQSQVQVKAPITQVNGDGMLQLKGGVTMIN